MLVSQVTEAKTLTSSYPDLLVQGDIKGPEV